MPNGESGTTNLSDLFGCVGANAQSCYGQSVNSKNCCGCATSPASPFAKFWPAAASIACSNGIDNPTWSSLAQPWLVFLKKGCPTAYTYAFDDSTSLFNCMSSGARNEVAYSIAFSSVPAPPIGDCAAAPSARRSSSEGLASASSAASGCSAFLSRAVGYEARSTDVAALPASLSIADWIETASFGVKKPTGLVVREDSPDDVDWLSYPVTRLRSAVKSKARRGIVARDELGTHALDTLGAERLLVPSSVGSGKTSGVPLAGLFDVYKCYRVKPAAAAPRPHAIEIGFVDASGPQQATVLSSPDSLCIEADLGEGLGNEQANVACYRIRPTSSGPIRQIGGSAGRLPVVGTGGATLPGVELAADNRFGSTALARRRANEVCVPIEVTDRGR